MFDIIFYTVQQGPLVDNHRGKVLEQHGEVCDRFGYLSDFAITLSQIWLEIILCLQLRLKRATKSKGLMSIRSPDNGEKIKQGTYCDLKVIIYGGQPLVPLER